MSPLFPRKVTLTALVYVLFFYLTNIHFLIHQSEHVLLYTNSVVKESYTTSLVQKKKKEREKK